MNCLTRKQDKSHAGRVAGSARQDGGAGRSRESPNANEQVCPRDYRSFSPIWNGKFPNMPCMKRVYRDKKRPSTDRQPGTKSASRPGDKPLTNHLSTADFVSAFGAHKILLFRAFEKTFRRRFCEALRGTWVACLLGELLCRRPVLPIPAPPPRCAPRPDPPVVCPGFGFDKRLSNRFFVNTNKENVMQTNGRTEAGCYATVDDKLTTS